MNLQHYRKYGIIELVAMVQQEYKETQEENNMKEMSTAAVLSATKKYSKEILEILSGYDKMKEYIDKKEKDQLEKFDGNPEKQAEILDACNKDRQGVEKWKSEKCEVLQDKLNESIQQEYKKALDSLIPESNESR